MQKENSLKNSKTTRGLELADFIEELYDCDNKHVRMSAEEFNNEVFNRLEWGIYQSLKHVLTMRLTKLVEKQIDETFDILRAVESKIGAKEDKKRIKKYKKNILTEYNRSFSDYNTFAYSGLNLTSIQSSYESLFNLVQLRHLSRTKMNYQKKNIKKHLLSDLLLVKNIYKKRYGRTFLIQYDEFIRSKLFVHITFFSFILGSKKKNKTELNFISAIENQLKNHKARKPKVR